MVFSSVSGASRARFRLFYRLGKVFQVQGWVEESRRSVVRIEWRTARGSNVYRVGHRGKADLHAVTPTKGWPYYVDHLPNYGKIPLIN